MVTMMRIVSSREAPAYMRYPGVLTSYRVGGTAWQCARSLLRLHTETLNAWTVIASFLFAAASCCYALKHGPPSAWPPFILYFSASLVSAPLSLGMHLFMPMGSEVFTRWRRMDVIGLALGGACFTVAMAWPPAMPLFGGTLPLAMLSVYATRRVCVDNALLPDGAPIKDTASFVRWLGTAITLYWIPMLYYACFSARSYELVAILCGDVISLSTGAAAFVSGWPQRHRPGRFDIVGHSHQILHVGAMIAHVCKFAFLWRVHVSAR